MLLSPNADSDISVIEKSNAQRNRCFVTRVIVITTSNIIKELPSIVIRIFVILQQVLLGCWPHHRTVDGRKNCSRKRWLQVRSGHCETRRRCGHGHRSRRRYAMKRRRRVDAESQRGFDGRWSSTRRRQGGANLDKGRLRLGRALRRLEGEIFAGGGLARTVGQPPVNSVDPQPGVWREGGGKEEGRRAKGGDVGEGKKEVNLQGWTCHFDGRLVNELRTNTLRRQDFKWLKIEERLN